MAMLQTLIEFVCVLWGGIVVDVMRISPRDPAHFTMATPPFFPNQNRRKFSFVRKKHFFSISSNWSLISRTAAQKESDLILNGTFGRAKVSGWEVDKLWSCYCLVSMDIIPQMEISIQHIYDKQFDVSVLFFCTYSNSTPMVVFIFTRNHFLSKDVGCLDSPKQWRSATWQLPQGFICRRIIGSILIDLKFDRKWLSNFQL